MTKEKSKEIELPNKIEKLLEENFKKYKPTKKQKKKIREKVKELYKKISYEPGEAIGVVGAQSISEPATQMSLDSSEEIITKKDGRIVIAEIGEFVDRAISDKKTRRSGNWEICDLSSEEVFVPSITKDEKIKWGKIMECSRHPAPQELMQVKTRSGRQITATASHSFLIREDNKIKTVSGKRLASGNRIPVVKKLEENCTSQLKVNSLINTKWAKKKLPNKIELDEKFGWIVGAYLAEGNCQKNYVAFSNIDSDFLQNIRNFANKFNFTYNEYEHERGFAKSHDIRVNSGLLSKLLIKACGTGSEKKKVPKFAYSAKEEFVSGLLKGYFDANGSISKKMIRASSNSEKLINGILLLLSRFGIFGTKQKGKQFSLTIPYKYATQFKSKIGSTLKEKKEKLEKLDGAKPSQEFIDQIPGLGNPLKELASKLGIRGRRINSFAKRGKIGRETLRQWIKTFDLEAKKKNIPIEENLEELKKAAYSDVVWDEIVSIKKVRASSNYVYDLSVEGTQTFTTFENVVTHNTMRTYHAAGALAKQVSLGLPRVIEIVDARREPSTPTMEIHLIEDLNSKEGAKKVAKKIRETKFKNIVLEDVIDLVNSQIEFKIDLKSLKELEVDKEDLKKIIKKYIKKYKVEIKDNLILLKSEKEVNIKNLQKTKLKALDIIVKGIKGITHAIVRKEKEEWIITTIGSNLRKVLKIEEVDSKRVFCNDIREVGKVLGIEATRNAIIRELSATLADQGLDVDMRHLILVADTMTVDGEIKAIGRYGVAGDKRSVLARANFETTVKHLTKAGMRGEVEKLNSIVGNVIVNQVSPIGTNMCDLVYKPKSDKK